MGDSFISDSGGFVQSIDSIRLRLRSTLANSTLSEFVIKNMGYVGIRLAGQSIEIRVSPQTISPDALIGLLYWLDDTPPRRVAWSTWEGGIWSTAIATCRQWLKRQILSQLDQAGKRGQLADLFIARRTQDAVSMLAPNLNLFLRLAPACATIDDIGTLAAGVFTGRFTIAAPVSGDRFVVKYLDGGYGFLDRRWKRTPVGRAIDDCSDFEYGQWVGRTFKQVLSTNHPIFEDIDALVRQVDGGRARYRYRRLVSRLTGPDDQPLILSTSLSTDLINLRG